MPKTSKNTEKSETNTSPDTSPDTSSDTSKVKTVTEADQIWDKIKDIDLTFWGLTNKKVHEVCQRVNISPSQLYLKSKISMLIAALDSCLNVVRNQITEKRVEQFNVDQTDAGFIIISRKSAVN